MIQALCDLCGKVLNTGEETSAYAYIEFKFENHQARQIQIKEDYCSDCTKKVKDTIHSLKITI